MTTLSAPLMEYGVHAFHRDAARHEVEACTDLTSALTALAVTRRQADAWARLVTRVPGGEWRPVAADEAATAYYSNRQEVSRG